MATVSGGFKTVRSPPASENLPPAHSLELQISLSSAETMNGREKQSMDDEEGVRLRVGEISTRVDALEQKVNEALTFYTSRFPRADKIVKEKSMKDSETVFCSQRMQELMREFGTLLQQIAEHMWAWPFLRPVDVKALGLDDYFEVIRKPMDFETMQKKMELKDDNGYKSFREIYADVRLVFTNAMLYNDEDSDVHEMAKTLLEIFEEKWLKFYPKVVAEETREKEEARALEEREISENAAMARTTIETDVELRNIYWQLEDLKGNLLRSCGKMTTEEKRKLSAGVSSLSAEDLKKALEIFVRDNPSTRIMEKLELDLDALSETTLWKLKFFVKKSLERAKEKASARKTANKTKRKKEIIDAPAKR